MSTTERKARKRAGIKFTKKQKVGTPPEERSYVTAPVPGKGGTKYERYSTSRSPKKVKAFLDRFTPKTEGESDAQRSEN